MTTAPERGKRAEQDRAARQAGDAAVVSLKAALACAGLSLPSLSSSGPVGGRAHVDLGGCSAEVAARLASLIDAGATARASQPTNS